MLRTPRAIRSSVRRFRSTAHSFAAVLGVAALHGVAGAAADAGVPADGLRRHAGTYGLDCADASRPRLRVTSDSLMVEQGGQRMTGRRARASASYFGAAPATGFQVALLSEVKGGAQLIFLVHADAAGSFVRLEGGPPVVAALGRTLAGSTFRRCDTSTAVLMAPQALPAPATGPVAGAKPVSVPELAALIDDPAFKRLYLRALGPKIAERWLSAFDGPAPPTRALTVDGTVYIVVGLCKAHDCLDHNAVFLYSAPQQRLYGLIQQRGRTTLIGAPPPSISSALEQARPKGRRPK